MSEDYSDQSDQASAKPNKGFPLIVKLWLFTAVVTPIVGIVALVAFFPNVKDWFNDFLWTQFEEPKHFEPTEAHMEALFTYQDLVAAPLQLAPVEGVAQWHAQDEFGGWYFNYRVGQMDQPGTAVSCALNDSPTSGSAQVQFESWYLMAGFETNERILPRLQVEPLALDWGDELSSGILLENSMPIGNAVVARKGTRTIWLEWRGGALHTVADLEKYVVPSLNEMIALER